MLLAGCLSVVQGALILEKCTRHAQCPANSGCRPSGCDGYTCRCDVNFVYSDDRSHCIPGKLVGQTCDGNLNKCLSPFALCSDGVCQCNELMEATTDGLCKAPYEAEIHQSCVEKFCVLSTTCINDVCDCPDDKREISLNEYWLDPFKARRCVDKNYSVGVCNGVKLPLLSDLPEEDGDTITDDNQPESRDKNHEDLSHAKQKPHSNPVSGSPISRDLQTQAGISKVKITGSSFTLDAINSKPTTAEYKEQGPIAVRIRPDRFRNSQDNELFETEDKRGMKFKDDAINDKGKDYVGSPIDRDIPDTVTDPFVSSTTNGRSSAHARESTSGFENYNDVTTQTMQFTSQTTGDTQKANLQTPRTLDSDEMEIDIQDDGFLPPVNQDLSEIAKHNDAPLKSNTQSQAQVAKAFKTGIRNQNGYPIVETDTERLQVLLKSVLGDMLQSKKKVNIYVGCIADLQCPAHAYCTKRGCSQLKQCLCSEGFMVNRNGTQCVLDGSRPCMVSEFHCDRGRCIPLSWVCDGVRDCPNNEDEGIQCQGVDSSHYKDRSRLTDRLEDKIDHETAMRMHLEKGIQDLRQEITRLREEYTEKMKPAPQIQTPSTAFSFDQFAITAEKRPSWPQHDDDVFYEGYTENIQNLLKKYEVYTLWGGKHCPRDKNTKTVYTGMMSSSLPKVGNGGTGDILCLPEVPEFDNSTVSGSTKQTYIQKTSISGFSRHWTCAVCQVQLISSVVTIPAKKSCPEDWKLEYAGVLVSAGSKETAQSRYVCVEKNAVYNGGLEDSRGHGPYLTPVNVECGRIPCPPYSQNQHLPCVVCSV